MAILSMEEEIKVDNRFEELDEIFSRTREPLDSDVAVIVLKIHHHEFLSSKKSYTYSILGKTLTEWLSIAFDACPVLEIECSESDDILEVLRPNLSDKKYTAVFYSDTPLLQRKTFLGIIDYAKHKGMNVCKLERGYVFVTDYLRTAQKLYSTTIPNLDFENDFLVVRNFDSFNKASQILKERILKFHLQNGVQILDTTWTSIDADVVIGDNVVIYPQNIIQGKTIIGDNTILQAGNTIIDSQIGNNCALMHCVVEKSKIRDNTNLEPFTFVLGGEVKRR